MQHPFLLRQVSRTAEPIEHKLLTFKVQTELSFATLLFPTRVYYSLRGHRVGALAQKLCQFILPLQANAIMIDTSFSPLRTQRCLLNETRDYLLNPVFRNNLVFDNNHTKCVPLRLWDAPQQNVPKSRTECRPRHSEDSALRSRFCLRMRELGLLRVFEQPTFKNRSGLMDDEEGCFERQTQCT